MVLFGYSIGAVITAMAGQCLLECCLVIRLGQLELILDIKIIFRFFYISMLFHSLFNLFSKTNFGV